MKPILGLTIGDPAGVGPEIIIKALSRKSIYSWCRPVVFSDKRLLNFVEKKVFKKASPPKFEIVDFDLVDLKSFRFGQASAMGGNASGAYIESAVLAAMNGDIDAVVTAPINKEAFYLGGWGKKYAGHTEMLASLTGAKRVALMLMYKSLRAVHVTSHISFKDVPRNITSERIFDTIDLARQGLIKMGFHSPKIAVCGLNPHAGDGGLFGDEEKKVIWPAVEKTKRKGWHVSGPLPADTVWPLVRSEIYDAGIAMYHDQGQIAVKLMAFSPSSIGETLVRGINVTLGLPIIRTSVAHGTAYAIAGKGIASEESLIDAMKLAASMASSKSK